MERMSWFWCFSLTFAIILSHVSGNSEKGYDWAEAKLSNDNSIPLIGLGVGNLQHELIGKALQSSFAPDKKVRLIDTAYASHNEHLISSAVSNSINLLMEDELHVVTKVWYTHLGYERTILSVKESLENLSSSPAIKIHLHLLLHWPRCDESISWMRCEEEENNLPQYIKDAGPPPHLDKENAWRASWKALEDIYLDHKHTGNEEKSISIASIGVSNFNQQDMEALVQDCRIKPHLFQGNVWSFLFDPYLMNLLHENRIVFQAYNVMNGLLGQRSNTPAAFSILTKVGNSLASKMQKRRRIGEKMDDVVVNEAMVIMSYLIQEGVGIIPRASSSKHQQENSPESLKTIPALSEKEKDDTKKALSALMRGVDVTVEATFHNLLSSGPVKVHWLNSQSGEEVPVVEEIHPGKSHTIGTHPGHTFAVYNKGKRREYSVTAFYGEMETFTVDEL